MDYILSQVFVVLCYIALACSCLVKTRKTILKERRKLIMKKNVLILILVILIGVVFDLIGVAVTVGNEEDFHAQASKKIKGANYVFNKSFSLARTLRRSYRRTSFRSQKIQLLIQNRNIYR